MDLDLAYLCEAFLFLRSTLVACLFEIFVHSKNTAYHHKKESYLIFKTNLERYLADGGVVLSTLVKAFLQLSRRDHSRFRRSGVALKPTFAGLGQISQQHFERYSPLSRHIVGGSEAELRDDTNGWVVEQLAQVRYRRRVSGDDPVEKDVLSLFRYLAVWGRIVNPFTTKSLLRVDFEVQDQLETAICKTFANLLDLPPDFRVDLEGASGSSPAQNNIQTSL